MQLQLRSERARAEYIPHLFNAPLGSRLGANLLSSSQILRVSPSSLRVASKLWQRRAQIDSFETAIWENSPSQAAARRDLNLLRAPDPLEPWMETLSFRLASVLWSYRGARSVHDRIEYLLNFFEATVVFLATLMLSAFHQVDDVYRRAMIDPRTASIRVQQGTFGAWLQIAQDLAKEVRRARGTAEKRRGLAELFDAERLEFFDAISARDLYLVLDRCR